MKHKIVWVNGTFDIVHIGHVRLLEYAKSLGEILVVGIDSDNRVMNKKGAGRPINPMKRRAEFLTHIKHVDYVYVFNSDQMLEETIKLVNADIIVVGHEYIGKRVIGSNLVKEVVYFDREREISTTEIANRLK